jgi:ElaB/YqjD/DUF883 family membrane-anchored ribosome-binding protein
MDLQAEVMRQQIEDTRTSLQDKVETLEQQVKETVQETTQAVTGTVEAVKETVETVRDTVETVKDTVEETVHSVKQTLSLNHMVQEHPWPMFAGAAAVGFIGGRLLSSLPPSDAGGETRTPPAYHPPEPPRRGWWSFIADHYSEELSKLKGIGIAAVGNVVREVLVDGMPPELARQTREAVDGFVTKLGAKPFQEPLFHLGTKRTAPGGSDGITKPAAA